ncbi:MAG: acetate kinase [Clostridiales bacterium]|nr:acetate kinase [Clostridiales bacterium]
MTNILVINAGSSSLKYQLIDVATEQVLAKGLCERIGTAGSNLTYKTADTTIKERPEAMPNHTVAIEVVLAVLTDPAVGVITDMNSIAAVGHRVVHGGELFTHSAMIDEECIEDIKACIPLGPLHNPANLMGIEACQKAMPNVPQVAVFDTTFGQSMKPSVYMYALPYEAYTEHSVRRYGFHGTSHRYVISEAMKKLDKPAEQTRIVSCHLGNGSSISCAKGGVCVDTSMGLTPLEGLPMGTRCGSIDPAIVLILMDRLGLSHAEMDTYMNKKSGVLGLSGVSSDFRDLWKAWLEDGNERAKLALDMFCLSVKKYIGSYAAEMGGLDAVVITAGVGENDRRIRKMILGDLEYLGLDIDWEKNETTPMGDEFEMSLPDSRVKAFVIPTNEELAIARDTYALIKA